MTRAEAFDLRDDDVAVEDLESLTGVFLSSTTVKVTGPAATFSLAGHPAFVILTVSFGTHLLGPSSWARHRQAQCDDQDGSHPDGPTSARLDPLPLATIHPPARGLCVRDTLLKGLARMLTHTQQKRDPPGGAEGPSG